MRRPPKATFGEPCTHCGRCCEAECCEDIHLIMPDAKPPCPALFYREDVNKYLCSLVEAEGTLFPPEKRLFSKAVGVGKGCTAPDDMEMKMGFAFIDRRCPDCNGEGDSKCEGTGLRGSYEKLPDTPPYQPTELGKSLRAARLQRQATFRDIAQLLECTPSHVSGIELGREKPTTEEIAALKNWIAGTGRDNHADKDF